MSGFVVVYCVFFCRKSRRAHHIISEEDLDGGGGVYPGNFIVVQVKSGPHRTRQRRLGPLATVRARHGPFRPVKTASGRRWSGFDRSERVLSTSEGPL